ncbi:hypothetical protein TWF281_008042 [Arthrobotrys megalospora]
MATTVGRTAEGPPLNDDLKDKDKPTAVESLLQGLSISKLSLPLQLPTSTRTRKETSAIPYLPTEIIQEILFYLSPHDFDSARLVCRDWFQASSCRALLQRNIDALHSPSLATSRSNHWSTQQIQTFSVLHLRRYFTTLVTEWPGSRHRVPCLKTRLDARALLDVPNTNTSNNGNNSNTATPNPNSYSPSESFECVGFSRQTGSFAAMVVGRRATRKLYICRLFSKTHLTLEFRPHRHSCCPCIPEPGPLYMIFDVKTALNLRIVKVDMEEVESPSSVRELSITFENGIVETYTFEGLAPHRIYQLNIKDKTVKTAAIAHNHGPNQNCGSAQCKAGNSYALSNPRYPNPTNQPGNKIRGFWQGFLHRFHKNPGVGLPTGLGWQQQTRGSPALLEVKAAMQPSVPKTMRVKLLDREEVCYVLSVPFDDQGNNVGIVAVSKVSGMVYVCGTSPELSRSKKGKDETIAYMHHWLSIPPRKSGRGEITHISVAPLIHYDVGQNDAYMAVLIGYANGEIWLWRMNREWHHLVPSSRLAKAGAELEDGERLRYTERPQQTPCVSTTIPPPLEVPIGKGQEPSLPVLTIISPAGQRVDVGDSNEKAWKLAHLPGLKALNFVARGVVILAADGKFVWGFDLRETHGFDKNTVHVPGGGVGLYGGAWGDGGEVSGFLNWGRGW